MDFESGNVGWWGDMIAVRKLAYGGLDKTGNKRHIPIIIQH